MNASDAPRANFHAHPWSIGGGGAAELKETLQTAATVTLGKAVSEVGIASWAGIDEVCVVMPAVARRLCWEAQIVKPFVSGDFVRDWSMMVQEFTAAPYNELGHLFRSRTFVRC